MVEKYTKEYIESVSKKLESAEDSNDMGSVFYNFLQASHKAVEDYEKRFASYQESLNQLDVKYSAAIQTISILEKEKRQWMQEKELQQNIIAHQLGNSDSVVQQLQDEIRNLKKKHNIRD